MPSFEKDITRFRVSMSTRNRVIVLNGQNIGALPFASHYNLMD